jgi:hypothetical protein
LHYFAHLLKREHLIRVLGLASYNILPASTGGQKAIALFYKYLARQVSLVCVTTRSSQPAAAEGYEVLNILSNSPLRYINLFYFFTLKKIIKEQQITHLQLEHPYYGWLGVWLKWSTGVKLMVHSHNIEGRRWKTLGKWWWKLLWLYERWVHRQADYNFFMQEEDRQYAVHKWQLAAQRCATITYGIEWDKVPAPGEKQKARDFLLAQYAIPSHHHLLLFNGTFSYLPNLNGLRHIINHINPALQAIPGFQYTLLICGKGIPEDITNKKYPNIVFTGFVPDIAPYFNGSDVFLNPVVEGGGIKTKLVEALGHNMNAVSSQNGALGVDTALCNGKLLITDDQLTGFSDLVVRAAHYRADTSADYFKHFYWGEIARKAIDFIGNKSI